MFLRGFISWWYVGGWLRRIQIIKARLIASADLFSVGLLLSTLFSPFRQISAGDVVGSISDHIGAFFDKLLSCVIGAFVRTFMIIFGLITMFIQVIFGVVSLIFWLTIPLLPVAGLIMAVIGWVPNG
ncbi:MAG TPA: hypothetical protein VFD55_00055 [Candidatus Angelobacter sp.]|nr:hypothetical protein [Candidatus Angelobacter sp.]